MSSGCGCKEVYRLPHLIPTPLVSALFGSSIPTFCLFLKMFFVLVPAHFCYLFNFSPAVYINKHKGDCGRPTEAI